MLPGPPEDLGSLVGKNRQFKTSESKIPQGNTRICGQGLSHASAKAFEFAKRRRFGMNEDGICCGLSISAGTFEFFLFSPSLR
jgi:hypothetical protein